VGASVFLGVSTLNLDAKGRMAIPAKHREGLAACCDSKVVVTINPRSGCLWLYPENEWREIERKVSRLPTLKSQNQSIQRLLLGHASEAQLDGQGRVILSPELKQHAKLDKKVALVGLGRKFEIWDEETWMTSREQWLAEAQLDDSTLSEELENMDF